MSDPNLGVVADDLIGRAAGAVARAVADPADSLLSAVVEAANAIAYDQDRFMSAWVLTSVSDDGSTWWRSPDGERLCYVTSSGEISFE